MDNVASVVIPVNDELGISKIVEVLGYSETTITSYIKKMYDELHIIHTVEGSGKGKYVSVTSTIAGHLLLPYVVTWPSRHRFRFSIALGKYRKHF